MEINSSDAFALASRLINHSNKNIFLTGKAGTGKTTFLRYIQENTHKKTVVVAPTGIAAINAGGVTIHSFFQLPFGTFIPDKSATAAAQQRFVTPSSLFKNTHINGVKRKIMQELELLIIDEVSMCRADMLDEIDLVLRFVRRRSNQPFGGVQVLFIGDLLQLPPVIKEEDWTTLKNYYKSAYFFDAQALQNNKPIYIELEKVYRQEDQNFIQLLNNLRHNKITSQDIQTLNKYYNPNFQSSPNDEFITITTHNYKADKINQEQLEDLPTKTFSFQAQIHGEFSEMAYPLDKELKIKQGAQIMFVKNDSNGKRFFNGKIAKVYSVDQNEITVQFNDTKDLLKLEKQVWQNTKYTLNEKTNEIEEVVIGTFTHYPIKLAWAITVHKSQGLTFNKAVIDIGSAFAAGQAYVALSRLRSLDGLILSSKLNEDAIDYDKNISEFSSLKSTEDELKSISEKESELYFKEYLSKSFDLKKLNETLLAHIRSYTKDESKSSKQHHKSWAIQIQNTLENQLVHSDKFIQYVQNILDKKESNYLETLHQKTLAAEGYFTPIIKNLCKEILKQIELVKGEKQSKTYLKELLELELSCNEQIKNFNKAIAISNSMIKKSEFSKNDIQHLNEDEERKKQIDEALKTAQKVSVASKLKGTKTEKTNTRDITYDMLKSGKTVEEVAKERNVTVSTIEGHVADLISDGKLNFEDFISKEKVDAIISAAVRIKSFQLSAIKSELGDRFTYGEIKLARVSKK